MSTELKNLYYYDVKIKMPFFERSEFTRLKISASSITHLLNDLEKFYLINPKYIEEIHKYKISKTRGNTRIDFTLIQKLDQDQIKTALRIYYQKKNRFDK